MGEERLNRERHGARFPLADVSALPPRTYKLRVIKSLVGRLNCRTREPKCTITSLLAREKCTNAFAEEARPLTERVREDEEQRVSLE